MEYIISKRSKKIMSEVKHCLDSEIFESIDLPYSSVKEIKYKINLDQGKLTELYYDSSSFIESDRIFLEALCLLAMGKNTDQALEITPREVDYFLRDNNSTPSFNTEINLDHDVLLLFKETLNAKNQFNYDLDQYGPYSGLSLVDKIKNVKNCLSYYNASVFNKYNINVELIEIDDLLIVLNINNREYREEILDELHQMFIEVFQDDNINVINEV